MNAILHDALLKTSDQALMAYGHRSQMIKTCEEMAELTTKLCKRLNNSPVTNEEIVDEVADVTFMVMQMALLFDMRKVEDRLRFKMLRTHDGINKFYGSVNFENPAPEVVPGQLSFHGLVKEAPEMHPDANGGL